MVSTFGTNISALRTQRKLAENSSLVSSTFERLSSGLRINRPSDDAAGLAVSSTLRTDAAIFSQGIRNLNDGLSVLNIADSAIEQLSTIVLRLSELANQAASGTLGFKQREALNAEAQSLGDEYFRIAKSTTYNKRQLFEGSFGSLRLQGGFGLDGGIQYGLGGAIGQGTFQSPVSFSTPSGTNHMVLNDVNGDGNMDLLSSSTTLSYVYVQLGNGDGSFAAATSFAKSGTGGSFVTGDFNGDGHVDIAASGYSNDTISILLGSGNGTFKTATTQSFGGAYNLAVADFNNDGIQDIVGTRGANSQVAVSLGRGDGTFGAYDSFSVTAKADHVATGDVNGDGNIDLVVTSLTSDEVQVMLGQGNGQFKSGTTLNTDPEATGIALADLNRDGVLDIIERNNAGGSFGVFMGAGNGSFDGGTFYATGANGQEFTVGDVNGDGILDIVYGSTGSTIGLRFGRGDGTFGSQTSVAVASASSDVKFGDFNNDGVLDIASASSGANPVSIAIANTIDGVSPLLAFDLSYAYLAKQSLSQFQQKLSQLAEQRGQIGAFQSRVSVAIDTLQVSRENYLAAGARITDADIAQETATLTRAQILEEAAASVLAQANQQPRLMLSLLTEQ